MLFGDQRISQDKTRAAMRGRGIGDLSTVAALVLETDEGSPSFIAQARPGARRAWPQEHRS